MRSRVRFLVSTAVFSVFALVLTYIEALIPIAGVIPVPGFKIGLSNVVVAYVLTLDPLSAFVIMLLKVVISALLFGSPISFIFSLVGGVLSFALMLIISRGAPGRVSYLGISAAGGFFHNAGQLAVTALLYGANVALAYSTPMLISGILCGGILGIILNLISVRIDNLVKKIY